jgi:TolB-like protein
MSRDATESGERQGPAGPPAAANPPDLSIEAFVSYASHDAPVANSIVEALEKRGLRCWIAPRDVTPGSHYADHIMSAISRAKVLVLVLSDTALASKHVGKEVERASSKGRPIIALRTDATPLTPAFEYFLSESQWIDVGAGGVATVATKLVEAVRSHADSAVSTGPVAGPAAAGHSEALRLRRWVISAVAVVFAIVFGYFVVDKFWLSRRVSQLEHQASTAPVPTVTPATQNPSGVGFAPPPHSIAVLPFANMSGDASQEYFSDGISEELLNALSRLNDLQVAARTSSFSFKGKDVDVSTIAHKLNVGAVLEGSVRRAGNTARITVQLINAVSGFHIWSQTYDRNLTDILKLQADVATSVAQQLEVKLAGDEAAKIEVGGTQNAAAYDAYLRGMQVYSRPDAREADYREALPAFDHAISLDPNFAVAYARRAATLDYIYLFGDDPSVRAALHEQARAAAERAIALAPHLGIAHVALAFTDAIAGRNLPEAAREYDRAVVLSPGSAWVQRSFGWFAATMGHFDLGITAERRAVSLDPQNTWTRNMQATVLTMARRYSEALAGLRDARVLFPGSHDIEGPFTDVLLASGQFDQARKECESPSAPLSDWGRHRCLALAYHALGHHVDAERELARFKAIIAADGDSDAYDIAGFYAQWGDKAAALQWLTTAERFRQTELMNMRADWEFDPIRDEPQFKAIEARMNFPP